MLAETLGAHPDAALDRRRGRDWFVMIAFIAAVPRWCFEAYFEVVRPGTACRSSAAGRLRPGHRVDRVLGFAGILVLMASGCATGRERRPPSRFTGSTMWQAYYVRVHDPGRPALRLLHPRVQAANDELEWPVWAAREPRARAILPAGPRRSA